MATKSISSTQAQNNFGQVLDDVTHNSTQYIVERRGIPQAILISIKEFASLLNDERKQQQFGSILREVEPGYHLGQILNSGEFPK